MTKMNNENMEDAFAKIRSNFETRGNEQGLQILDGCEEQWNAVHNLTDRQVAWLESQLNGSWRSIDKSAVKDYEECRVVSPQKRGLVPISSTPQDTEKLLDAMIHERLMRQGKVIVDVTLLTELEELISEIKQAPNR